jgi:sugar phosphate isomerase/epimerase
MSIHAQKNMNGSVTEFRKNTFQMNILLILLAAVFISPLSGSAKGRKLDNIFYCFNNAMTLPNAPSDFTEQAKLVKKLGLDGFGAKGEENYFAFRKALDQVGVKIPEIYIPFNLEPEKPAYNPLLKELIKDSGNRDLLVSLHLHSEKFKNNKEDGDLQFAKSLTELADFAAQYKVKLAIYPHVAFYCETMDHTLKLVKMVNRPNLGAVFNLCHFLKVEGAENMEEKAKEAIPYVFMVSVCGADAGDTKQMNWDRLIQPLGKGSFDPYPLVKLLRDNGYMGIFGLQCFNIRQDCREALALSVKTWKGYKKRYAK